MFRWGLLFLLLWFSSIAPVSAAELTQRDWMEQLVDSLGWGYGLPDDPVTGDYIRLLSGVRRLHVEVEGHYRRSDRIAVKHLTNYGKFSGTGWVSGRGEVVQLHLEILVPRNGRYQLSAVTRLPGVRLELAGQSFVASAGENLTYQELGQVGLVAGQTEVIVTLPPNAGIDYLQLNAPPLPVIAPLNGWQPDRRLETTDLALTMLQALDLLVTLPVTGLLRQVEAESAGLQDGVQVTHDRYLGVPSGNAWIRARNLETAWQLPFTLQQPGCYQLFLRGSSRTPVHVELVGILEKRVVLGPALESYPLGNYCLPRGKQLLELDLPPWAGIDSLELRQLDVSPATLTRLLGLPDMPTGIDRQVVNELLQLLSSLTR